MSFSSTTKEELIRLPFGKPCCMLSELNALTQTVGSLSLQGRGRVRVTYRVENAALARRIFLLLRSRLGLVPRLHFVQYARLGGRRVCVLDVEGEGAQKLLIALHMMEQDEEGQTTFRRTTLRHPLTRRCCRSAFLRGAFLGAGSMTSPDKDYHFEWVATDPALSQMLSRLLEKCNLPLHQRTRRGQEVIYLKGAQQIADVLALMGASHALLDMENTRITRQMRGSANRASNCDEHNSERQVSAATEQIEAIKLIAIHRGLTTLPVALQEIATLRLENPDRTLTELGQMAHPPISKSGVNHRMRRLLDLSKQIEAQEPEKE